jgi:hypothetical protein
VSRRIVPLREVPRRSYLEHKEFELHYDSIFVLVVENS